MRDEGVYGVACIELGGAGVPACRWSRRHGGVCYLIILHSFYFI